jgi:multiple sugar transport system permease protein
MAATAVRPRVAAVPVRARSRRRVTPQTIALYAIALLALVILLGPLVWMFGTALKERTEVFTWPPSVFPRHPHWDNFVQAWSGAHFSRYFLNSAIVTLVSVGSNALLGSMAGYGFARLRFPGRNFLFLVVMVTLMVPNAVLIVPLFLMMKNVPFTDPGGWLNTYQGVILPTAVTGFSVFLMRQFLQGIPRELDQAAAVDGANLFQVFWHVILPLTRPVLAIIAVFTALSRWNDYLWPLVAIRDPDLYTVQIGLKYFVGQHAIEWNLLMAGAVIAAVPMLLVYVLFQPLFEQSLSNLGTGLNE